MLRVRRKRVSFFHIHATSAVAGISNRITAVPLPDHTRKYSVLLNERQPTHVRKARLTPSIKLVIVDKTNYLTDFHSVADLRSLKSYQCQRKVDAIYPTIR